MQRSVGQQAAIAIERGPGERSCAGCRGVAVTSSFISGPQGCTPANSAILTSVTLGDIEPFSPRKSNLILVESPGYTPAVLESTMNEKLLKVIMGWLRPFLIGSANFEGIGSLVFFAMYSRLTSKRKRGLERLPSPLEGMNKGQFFIVGKSIPVNDLTACGDGQR